jgi:hypothetical protein
VPSVFLTLDPKLDPRLHDATDLADHKDATLGALAVDSLRSYPLPIAHISSDLRLGSVSSRGATIVAR